jgi:hypothetical protein
MRLAGRRAQEATPLNSPTSSTIPRSQLMFPQREGRKYRFRCTNLQDRTEELFDLLQLDRGQKQYWLQRYHGYNPNEFTNKPYIAKCVECAILANFDEDDANTRDTFNNVIVAIDNSVKRARGTPASPEAPCTEAVMLTREQLITEVGKSMLRDQQLGQGGTHDPTVIRRSPRRSRAGRPYDRSGRGRMNIGRRNNSTRSFNLDDVLRGRKLRRSIRSNNRGGRTSM